ncbi:DUF7935 family protein [Pararcticibacter amylolyticus]|uniref:Uncharacterized protein n=1 Tax=Pararcticibacter amylolyticus TaxID=2173175 RepID=A0A2U2P9R2_9SPHI|nr:hypothetical protein [Pararcticibacter amylolyticus]PWG78136.1 hypothetical protein DDR33_23765 [Pararcticibacter amylolyticus]
MEWSTALLLDIIKLTVAGSLVFLIVYLTIKPLIERSQGLKLVELKKEEMKTTLPLRLQAYERIVLFVERINPANLILRTHSQGIGVYEYQNILVNEIRNEFQHNIAQQIYLSSASWSVVKRVKEETITLINNVARNLPEDATGLDLSKTMLTHLASLDQNPYDTALEIIKQDVQKLF